MVVVDELHERLDLAALLLLGLAHGPGDLGRLAVDARHDAVAELALLVAVVEGLDDNRLLAGIAARKHDHDLSGFEKLAHCET